MSCGLLWALASFLLGDILPPKPGMASVLSTAPLFSSSFINSSLKHGREGFFKNHERKHQSFDF